MRSAPKPRRPTPAAAALQQKNPDPLSPSKKHTQARRRSTALLVAAMLAMVSAASAALTPQQQQQEQLLIPETAATNATTTTSTTETAPTSTPTPNPAQTLPPIPDPFAETPAPMKTPVPTSPPAPPPLPYTQPDPSAAARAVGATARGAVVLPSLAYHASVPAETVAALAKEAVSRAAARAKASRAAAASQDSSSVDAAAAAMDPRPDEKPTSAPAQVWKPLAGAITASPMEIISKAEGERPLVLNGKKTTSIYGPPPEKLAGSSTPSKLATSSSASSSPSSSDSTAPSGAGINGLGGGGGSASIEADGSGVCDRNCYNAIVPLTQNPSGAKLGGLNLGAEGAASFSGFSQQPSAERDAWRRSFVAAEGRNFKVGNATWFFGGTNQYSLTQTGEKGEKERGKKFNLLTLFWRFFFFEKNVFSLSKKNSLVFFSLFLSLSLYYNSSLTNKTKSKSMNQPDWWRDDQVETAMREHASRGAG